MAWSRDWSELRRLFSLRYLKEQEKKTKVEGLYIQYQGNRSKKICCAHFFSSLSRVCILCFSTRLSSVTALNSTARNNRLAINIILHTNTNCYKTSMVTLPPPPTPFNAVFFVLLPLFLPASFALLAACFCISRALFMAVSVA